MDNLPLAGNQKEDRSLLKLRHSNGSADGQVKCLNRGFALRRKSK
jgi:hypothetical protein